MVQQRSSHIQMVSVEKLMMDMMQIQTGADHCHAKGLIPSFKCRIVSKKCKSLPNLSFLYP